LHRPANASRNGVKQLRQVEVGHNSIVDVEEEPQAVSLARELVLQFLRGLVVQGIFYRDGNLCRHKLWHPKRLLGISANLRVAKIQCSQTAAWSGKRQAAEGSHARLDKPLPSFRITAVVRNIVNSKTSLRLPHRA